LVAGKKLDPTDNLESLHAREEELRAQSVAFLKVNPELSDHLTLIAEAMNAIYALAHDHPHQSDDEMTLQLLGIRLFNAAAASVKLALSGYYQKSFDQVRDVVETYFLVDYLTTNRSKIAEWKTADKNTRITKFGPGIIRNELDKRDGYTSGQRKKIYDLISELASHASYPGFQLVMNQDSLGEIGPFYSEKILKAWVSELAVRLGHAAIILLSNTEGQDMRLLLTRAHYLRVMDGWRAKYLKSA
jgi:hypothetical protein